MVLLGLINSVPDVILSGAFVTVLGRSTWVEESRFCEILRGCAPVTFDIILKTKGRH